MYAFSAYSNEHLEPEGVVMLRDALADILICSHGFVCVFVSSDWQIPTIKFEYDISPLSVLLSYKTQPLYRFITRFMAIIGGVFAVLHLPTNARRLRELMRLP